MTRNSLRVDSLIDSFLCLSPSNPLASPSLPRPLQSARLRSLSSSSFSLCPSSTSPAIFRLFLTSSASQSDGLSSSTSSSSSSRPAIFSLMCIYKIGLLLGFRIFVRSGNPRPLESLIFLTLNESVLSCFLSISVLKLMCEGLLRVCSALSETLTGLVFY